MSKYTNGWTWNNAATEEQMADASNQGAIARFAQEIAQLYNSIPDPRDENYSETLDAIAESYDTPEEADRAIVGIKSKHKRTWGEIEALEEMMEHRGARLKDDYEDFNEDAPRMRLMDSMAENDRG